MADVLAKARATRAANIQAKKAVAKKPVKAPKAKRTSKTV